MMLSFDDFSYLVFLLDLSGPVYQTLVWAIYEALNLRGRQKALKRCLIKNYGFLPVEHRCWSRIGRGEAWYEMQTTEPSIYHNSRELYIFISASALQKQKIPYEGGLRWEVIKDQEQHFAERNNQTQPYVFSSFNRIERDRFFSVLNQLLPRKN